MPNEPEPLDVQLRREYEQAKASGDREAARIALKAFADLILRGKKPPQRETASALDESCIEG